MAKVAKRPRFKKKFSFKKFESELLNCVNHLVEALPNKNTDEFSDEFFNEMLINEQNNLLKCSSQSPKEMIKSLDDSSDFSGFLDFAKVEDVHIQLLDAFNKEDTDISSIDELIDSVKFCKEKWEEPTPEKFIEKDCVAVEDYCVKKSLMNGNKANVRKTAKNLKKFSRIKNKKKASDLAKYRTEVKRGQNDLWNACLPYMDAQEHKLFLPSKIVLKAVEVVNDVKTKNRLLLEEKNKLKLTQVKLLKTLICKLKNIAMPARKKRRRTNKANFMRKKPINKLHSGGQCEYFKGFSNFEFSLSERYKEILASLDEKISCSSIDVNDEATFSGFESADDEICASSFYGFNNRTALTKNVIDSQFSPSPCIVSYKLCDSIPDLKFVFPPIKISSTSRNIQTVKKFAETPVRKGLKRTNSGSFQVQPSFLEPTVRMEHLPESFVKSTQDPKVTFIKGSMPKVVSKEKGNLQTIPTLFDRKNVCSKLHSFMVKSEANNKNSLKIKIIRNAELPNVSDSNPVNSNSLPRSNFEEAKRIKREVKHPEKYAAYVTNNRDLKMLKKRLQSRKGKLKGQLISEFGQNKNVITVSQEPRISSVLFDIHSDNVKKENTFPSANVTGRLVKSVSYSPVYGNYKPQHNSLSDESKNLTCHSSYGESNKPSLLKEIKDNQNILADKLAYINDVYKRNGCEASIIKLNKSMDIKRKQLNKESKRPNFPYGKYIDHSVQISNVVKDKCLSRGDSVLELNRHILKKGISVPCLSTSFTADDEITINDNLNKKQHHTPVDVNQVNNSTVATKESRLDVLSGSGLQEKESFTNGVSTLSPLYSSNGMRGYPYRIVPRVTSASNSLPKMPTLIPYYSLTSANNSNTILSEAKLPKLTNAVNLQKKTLKSDLKSHTTGGLPYANNMSYVDSTNETMFSFDYTSMSEKNPPVKTVQISNVPLTASQGHYHLPMIKPSASCDETGKRSMENNINNISANAVKAPILQKQHKCSNCGFITTKLGVFKRHQLIHSEASLMPIANAGNNDQLPKHTSPVKEILPLCKDESSVESTIATTTSFKSQNYEQRVNSLLMSIKDTPGPMLLNERLFLKSWTRVEKLELMWCYYYSHCNVFPEDDVVGRLKSTLMKRGKLSIDKISSDCLLKIVYSILSANKVRAQDLYPIKINAEITARKEHLDSTRHN